MTCDPTVSSLGLLAEALGQQNGYEPNHLHGISLQASGPVSSFIKTILASDEHQMQKGLADLADHLHGMKSSVAWFDLGRVAASLFFRHAAEEYFEKSARLAEEMGDRLRESHAWFSLGSLRRDDEDWDGAFRFFESALHAQQACERSAFAADIMTNLAYACRQRGDLSSAEKYYSQAIIQLGGDDWQGKACAHHSLGEIYSLKGNLQDAEKCYEKSLLLREKAGDREGVVSSLVALASIHQLTGKARKVQSCLEKARHLQEECGEKASAARMRLLLADYYFQEGRQKEAAQLYENGLMALNDCDWPPEQNIIWDNACWSWARLHRPKAIWRSQQT
jgi:tetratricopeptide (TPR) repeat protein